MRSCLWHKTRLSARSRFQQGCCSNDIWVGNAEVVGAMKDKLTQQEQNSAFLTHITSNRFYFLFSFCSISHLIPSNTILPCQTIFYQSSIWRLVYCSHRHKNFHYLQMYRLRWRWSCLDSLLPLSVCLVTQFVRVSDYSFRYSILSLSFPQYWPRHTLKVPGGGGSRDF